MHVLLVEDEAKLADVIARNLRAHQFGVAVAPTALDALVEMEAAWPDVLILDINLPDHTGWDLLRRITPEERERLAVIVMSAGPISPRRIEELRPDRHIEKPFPMDALVRMLGEVGKPNGGHEAGHTAHGAAGAKEGE